MTTESKRKPQARRATPKQHAKRRATTPTPNLTLGDLVAAAWDSCGDEDTVARVLGSYRMQARIGRRLVFT